MASRPTSGKIHARVPRKFRTGGAELSADSPIRAPSERGANGKAGLHIRPLPTPRHAESAYHMLKRIGSRDGRTWHEIDLTHYPKFADLDTCHQVKVAKLLSHFND
jgi:hypothetical protein